MNELTIKENKQIEDLIFEIRGMNVIFDNDIANLFGYDVKNLNRQVQRNIERFPNNYCFQLTTEEYNSLRCQNGTLKNGRGQHRKYNPYVFTEYGVTMLAGILKSEIAIRASIKIVDTFIRMHRYMSSNYNGNRLSNIETKLIEHDIKFEEIFNRLEVKVDNHIFFEGEIYDAYSLLIDILNVAKNEIIIIDNYIDKSLLDILSKIKTNIIVVTSKINERDLEKYNKQYHNIRLIINKSFHDRFIIIDKKILYHCGSSFKDLGKKCFAINKIEDVEYLNTILKIIN